MAYLPTDSAADERTRSFAQSPLRGNAGDIAIVDRPQRPDHAVMGDRRGGNGLGFFVEAGTRTGRIVPSGSISTVPATAGLHRRAPQLQRKSGNADVLTQLAGCGSMRQISGGFCLGLLCEFHSADPGI
jgi:hypothetical protein